MIFSWTEWNIDHIAKHGVSRDEAEDVVRGARPPYPLDIGDEKWLVIGPTRKGRLLQVIYLWKSLDDVEAGSVSLLEIPEEQRVVEVVFVIHSMGASSKMKRQDRRRRKP